MKNNIIDDAQNVTKLLSSAILDCYGLDKVSKNVSMIVDDEEITAWYICGISKDDLESKKLTDEELIELYNFAF